MNLKMNEEEEEPSTTSDDESHNAEDEPESDTEEVRADINNRIDQYLSTEHWTERQWITYQNKIDIVGTIITGEHYVL